MKIKHYLYNAIDYMLQAGESEQFICEYLGMSKEELVGLLDRFEI